MKQIILALFLTVALVFGVIESYKYIPLLINDKFRGSFKITINEDKTKSDLYSPKDLKIEKVDNDKVSLTWNFDRKEFTVDDNLPSEYGILSGYRIYKDGYWHKDIPIGSKKFIDEDLYPNETYKYSVSALTFDNKIEGLKSSEIIYKTGDFTLNTVQFPIISVKKYLAEGDSITVAENLPKGEGWAEMVAKNFGFTIFNKAVSGSTSFSVDDRIEKEVKEIDPDLVTIAVGVNDIFVTNDGIGNVSMSTYHDNLKSIVKKINADKKRDIVLLNIFYINCCQEKHMAWNKEIKGIANSLGVLYIDVSSPMIDKGGKALLTGDLHPNSDGHKVISEVAVSALNQFVK